MTDALPAMSLSELLLTDWVYDRMSGWTKTSQDPI